MYDCYSVGKTPVKASTNGSCKLTIHFQQKMNDLFHGFECIRAYTDGLLILTEEDWTDHVEKLELTPNKLKVK